MGLSRRRLLQTGVAAAAVTLAGCGGSSGGSDATPTEDSTATDARTSTDAGERSTEAGGGTAPPGADVLGGPDDLKPQAEVRATVLDEDQGAGRYVFTPAVVWLEPGGTVFWSFEAAEHTVTVYHPQYDKPMRVPNGVEIPFNSEFNGVGSPDTSYNFVFDTEGVWNYFCKNHEDRGMVGLVVVGEPQAEGGVVRPDDVESEAASEKLTRLLKSGGIVG